MKKRNILRKLATVLAGLLFFGSLAHADGNGPVVSVTGSGAHDVIVVPVGQEGSIDFDATIDHDPTPHQECQLNGMTWTWDHTGGTEFTSNDASATLTFEYDTPGTYTVSASATASFGTSCSVGGDNRPGDPISVGPGGKTYTIKAVQKVWSADPGIGIVMDPATLQQKTVGGVGVVDGRLLAPQDQTKNPAVPSAVFVPAGKSITISMEGASDYDTWTYDANGDGQIDPNPANGEKGIVADSVSYLWSGGGSFNSPTSSSTTWSATTPGTYNLVCTVNDGFSGGDTGIGTHEGGSRNDADDTYRVQVQIVVFKAELQVKRQGTPDSSYGSSATVAAGGVGDSNHQADVRIKVTPAQAGIPIPAPELVEGDGYPAGTGNATLTIGGTTDAQGYITGTFKSSNLTTSVGIELDTGQSGGLLEVNIAQNWNLSSTAWTYDDHFDYGTPSTVTFKPSFTDGGDTVPITGHSMKFLVPSATVWEWNENDERYIQTQYTIDPDEADPLGDPPIILAANLDSYGPFSPATTGDSGGGTYTTSQTVPWDVDNIIDEVGLGVEDEGTYR